MHLCSHSNWIDLFIENENLFISFSNRFQNLVGQVPAAHIQKSNFLIFVGNRQKTEALKELFQIRQITRRRSTKTEIHLNIDSLSIYRDHPLLIADGDTPLRASRR